MYFTSQLILSASQIPLPLSHALWPPKQSVRDYATEVINSIGPSHIGACRSSCVGTRARFSYAAFDAQLWKAYFVTTVYAIHTSVHAYAICWWPCVFTVGPRDMSTHDLKQPGQCPGMPFWLVCFWRDHLLVQLFMYEELLSCILHFSSYCSFLFAFIVMNL